MKDNSDAPFTEEDVASYNRLSHFPIERIHLNASFASASAQERNETESHLRKAGIDDVPSSVERALERLRRARYQLFMATARARELLHAWGQSDATQWAHDNRPQRAQRLLNRGYDELNVARLVLVARLRDAGALPAQHFRDTSAIQALKEKIEQAEVFRARMHEANAILRRAASSETEKLTRLRAECGLDERVARELMKPNRSGFAGYAEWELTVNRAAIGRMNEELIALLQTPTKESVEFQFPGGRVEDNVEKRRVRISYDQNPASAVVEQLRSHGFRRSSSLRCWERTSDESTPWSVTRITGVRWPDAYTPAIDPVAMDEAEARAVEGVGADDSTIDKGESIGGGMGVG